MATLKHTELANEEANALKIQSSVPVDIKTPHDPFSERSASTGVSFVVFKLAKKPKGKGKIHLSNVCDSALNPKTNKRERIYLLNGADSIWYSDLKDFLKEDKFYNRGFINRDILFQNGICRVKADDHLMLEYMRAHTSNVGKRRNGSGKFDYYEYNAAEEQKEREQYQMLKLKMVVKANEMPIDKAKMLASFLGVSFVDELGMPKSDESIKTDLMMKADTNPVQFQQYIDSKEVEISYLVKKAIIDGKIDYNSQTSTVLWSKGQGFICKIPSSKKHYEYLTELAMTNSDEGRQFLENLKSV